MALPIVIPAIANGAAALSAALGLTALASSKTDNDNISFDTSGIKDIFIQQNMPLMIASMAAKAKMQQPTKTNVPTEENALVLKPEYRTVTTPTEFIGHKPFQFFLNDEYEDDDDMDETVSEQQTHTPSPNNKKPQKNDDKKPFWETTPGKILKWTLIGGGSAAALPWVGGGVYRYFTDYIPYALSKTINTSEFNNSSNEIDREGTEQAWEDMKVGRKPGQ